MSTTASAPGKAILFGEHAVVYGYPAVAVPLSSIRAYAEISEAWGDEITLEASDIGFSGKLNTLPANDPFRVAVQVFCDHTKINISTGIDIRLRSDIPIASGMGSGAAIHTAIMKALFNHYQIPFTETELASLVYQIEKLYHGTPSGIDNTVTCYGQSILYQKEQEIKFLEFPHEFFLVIADSGISTPTRITVNDVRLLYQSSPKDVRSIFESIRETTLQGLKSLRCGDWQASGKNFTANHQLLHQLSVSCPQLDRMVATAIDAGAYGAKLSGGGRGGIIVALVKPERIPKVTESLLEIGAENCFTTKIGPT